MCLGKSGAKWPTVARQRVEQRIGHVLTDDKGHVSCNDRDTCCEETLATYRPMAVGTCHSGKGPHVAISNGHMSAHDRATCHAETTTMCRTIAVDMCRSGKGPCVTIGNGHMLAHDSAKCQLQLETHVALRLGHMAAYW